MNLFTYFRYNIGFCLVFCGVPLGMLLNFFIPFISWSPLIMFFSICCLWGTSSTYEYQKWNKYFKTIVAFMIFMLCYRMFYDGNDVSYVNKLVTFQLYILSLCYILNRNQNLIDFDYIPVLIIYTSILSIVFAIMYYINMFSWDFFQESGGDTFVLEVFTANIAAFINMMACLVSFTKKNILFNVFIVIMIIVDMYVIMQSGKRSYFVSIFFAIFFLLYKRGMVLKSIPYLCFGLLLLIMFVPAISEQLMELFDRTISGFSDVYGSKDVAFDENSSSAIRAYNKNKALNDLSSNYSFFNYIFGAGYCAYYIDNPLLESYMDMGIAGFIFYVMIIIVKPLKIGFLIPTEDKKSLFVFLVAIMNIVICITNNNPYFYIAYTPLCVLALYYPRLLNIK